MCSCSRCVGLGAPGRAAVFPCFETFHVRLFLTLLCARLVCRRILAWPSRWLLDAPSSFPRQACGSGRSMLDERGLTPAAMRRRNRLPAACLSCLVVGVTCTMWPCCLIMLQFQCYCEKIWYGVVRCRVVDAQNMTFPRPWCVGCPDHNPVLLSHAACHLRLLRPAGMFAQVNCMPACARGLGRGYPALV
jgi:hypothetical protein